MANVRLLNYAAQEITFANKMQKTETFELTNRCSYSVGFAPNKLCRGEMTAEVFNKNNPESFKVKIVVIGNFVCEDEADKDDVHRMTYKILFPHVKALVTALTVTANIPPIFFPNIDIDGQSVYMVENPKKH